MVKSMTGYGISQAKEEEQKFNVEIRAVNHRFLDISVVLPNYLFHLENKIKKLIKSYFNRGRIELFLTVEQTSFTKKSVQLNWDTLSQYMDELKKAQSKYNLEGAISVDTITRIEDLFLVEEGMDETNLEESIDRHVRSALEQVYVMRLREGEELEKDLHFRLEKMKDFIKQLGDRRDTVIMEYRERFKKRINTYIEDMSSIDDSRLMQEVAFLVEKGDITEELTRMDSHVRQFSDSLMDEEPIGRRLDFILQEMHREVNTIGSKSSDACISGLVVDLKSEIEKMKEQVQNIE